MIVRPAEPRDAVTWLELRNALWPASRHDHEAEIAGHLANAPESELCLLAELPGRGVVGFAEVRLREYAEGCLSSPVGYLEGIFVRAGHRAAGVGRALVEAAEAWARTKGCSEMASDREWDNEASGAFHAALGFTEVDRIVCLRKGIA